MRNVLALARASAALRQMLQSGIDTHGVRDALGTGLAVSLLPPDANVATDQQGVPRLNLFLLQASPSASLRPIGSPQRDASGQHVDIPSLALDLRYLLTAYTSEELHPEVLLAYALQVLNESPVLSDDALRASLSSPRTPNTPLPAVMQALRGVQPAPQATMFKILPFVMTTEDMSHLWQSFRAPYRPSLAFQVSMVMTDQ